MIFKKAKILNEILAYFIMLCSYEMNVFWIMVRTECVMWSLLLLEICQLL